MKTSVNKFERKKIKCGAGSSGGGIVFGDGLISIQSMLNVTPEDTDGNIAQALRLAEVGCEVIRVAVPAPKDAALISSIKNALTERGYVNIPLVADIHYNYKCALEAVSAGADKLRINPGNLPQERLKEVAAACRLANIPIRVGANGGSVPAEIAEKYGGGNCAAALCDTAKSYVKKLNELDFDNIVVSIKSSDVRETIAAYRMAYAQMPYPLHVGVTEAGTVKRGIIKSAVGIGSLIADGIGDTIRVSLTAPPEKEVAAALDILTALGLRGDFDIVSCPTCGRTGIDVAGMTDEVEAGLVKMYAAGIIKRYIKVAVMGCAVNGIGESKGADCGICGSACEGFIIADGSPVLKCPEAELVPQFLNYIEKTFASEPSSESFFGENI